MRDRWKGLFIWWFQVGIKIVKRVMGQLGTRIERGLSRWIPGSLWFISHKFTCLWIPGCIYSWSSSAATATTTRK